MRLFSLFCMVALAAYAQSPSVFTDPASLANELHRLEKVVVEGRGTQVASSLPASWVVETPVRRYSISTAPLRKLVKSPDQAQIWLDQLARQLESFRAPPAVPSSARAQLDRILSRREFAPVRPPTFGERLSQRIVDWIAGILRNIFAYAKQHPTTGTILFCLAAAVAVGFLGFWLFSHWSRQRRTPLPQPDEAPVPSFTSQQWVLWSKEARDRGDIRTAIRCAYWAAVVHLQDRQLLPRDLTRTPREYLGLLPKNESSHATLAALTSALERFWYAARTPSPNDLRESLDNLEALGCRLD